MNKGGAATAVLVIGAGVLLLALGWQGTLGTVWDAITGGGGGTTSPPAPPTVPPPETRAGCKSDKDCKASEACRLENGTGHMQCFPKNTDTEVHCASVPDMHRVVIEQTGAVVCVHGGGNGDVSGREADGSCKNGWEPGYEWFETNPKDDKSRLVCVRPVRGAGAATRHQNAAHQWSRGITASGKYGLLYEPNVRERR